MTATGCGYAVSAPPRFDQGGGGFFFFWPAGAAPRLSGLGGGGAGPHRENRCRIFQAVRSGAASDLHRASRLRASSGVTGTIVVVLKFQALGSAAPLIGPFKLIAEINERARRPGPHPITRSMADQREEDPQVSIGQIRADTNSIDHQV